VKYTLILAPDPAKAPVPGSPEEGRFFQAFFAFNQEIEDMGVYLGGEPLQDASTATTIRVVDGQVSATDGPFAETKEQIAGFYLLECADLDEALSWAAKVPTAAWAMARSRSGPASTTPRPWGELPGLAARLG
jgi:hypothetical protein